MNTDRIRADLEELPRELRAQFAPLRKRSLGLAFGVLFAGTLALLTAYHAFLRLALELEPGVDAVLRGDHLGLLAQFFYGYQHDTIPGALIGIAWAFGVGWLVGFLLAFCRNAFITAWVLLLHSKAELAANRDFLDHI